MLGLRLLGVYTPLFRGLARCGLACSLLLQRRAMVRRCVDLALLSPPALAVSRGGVSVGVGGGGLSHGGPPPRDLYI